MCICMYVCTPVEHRRQPLLSSLGIPSTSCKTGSLSGPDQPSRLDWPTREHQETSPYLSSTQHHTWQFTRVSNGKNILQVIFIWGKLPCIVIDSFRVTFDEPFLLFEVEVRLGMDSAVRERPWKKPDIGNRCVICFFTSQSERSRSNCISHQESLSFLVDANEIF